MVTTNYTRYSKIFVIQSFLAIIVGIIFVTSFPSLSPSYSYAKITSNSIIYHLTSDEPRRVAIVISDATSMLKLGHKVTLWLSIDGVQIGVKHPPLYLGLDCLTRNVTNFIAGGGRVVICEKCLRIAGYSNNDIIDGAIIGNPEIMSNLLSNATVVSY